MYCNFTKFSLLALEEFMHAQYKGFAMLKRKNIRVQNSFCLSKVRTETGRVIIKYISINKIYVADFVAWTGRCG
jgi:hypothetical protein